MADIGFPSHLRSVQRAFFEQRVVLAHPRAFQHLSKLTGSELVRRRVECRRYCFRQDDNHAPRCDELNVSNHDWSLDASLHLARLALLHAGQFR